MTMQTAEALETQLTNYLNSMSETYNKALESIAELRGFAPDSVYPPVPKRTAIEYTIEQWITLKLQNAGLGAQADDVKARWMGTTWIAPTSNGGRVRQANPDSFFGKTQAVDMTDDARILRQNLDQMIEGLDFDALESILEDVGLTSSPEPSGI